ncbi:hypothetical protein GQ44DRAFT_825615 [Phaeosphaeriaceae sp. PMI808]|nr:hypothetical protein GQ44DRAFT_825615 [Phaeosphaeriaceae sp. PMI808]
MQNSTTSFFRSNSQSGNLEFKLERVHGGVGGYLLQGGLSFLSAQYGFAVDSIVGWEAVMPDGSVVNVDAATEPDIAVAMRGSGSQSGWYTHLGDTRGRPRINQ